MESYIGSPLTSNAVRVLMLGGGELAKGLVGAFQNLGLEVHVVDGPLACGLPWFERGISNENADEKEVGRTKASI